jgi:hypothetical protein
MTFVFVVAGLDPAIHESGAVRWAESVDAWVKPGHDGVLGAGEW